MLDDSKMFGLPCNIECGNVNTENDNIEKSRAVLEIFVSYIDLAYFGAFVDDAPI